MAYIAPSLARLRSQTSATFPKRKTASDGWIGDAAHQAGVSDHNPDPTTGVVRALDLTATAAEAKKITASATADSRVAYVIYDRRIWTSSKGWQSYSGDNPHTNHVHISLRHDKAAEDSNTDWKNLEMALMCSPILGHVSSEYGMRGGVLHAGIDIATGGVSRPVYAAYAGRISNIVRTRVHDRNIYQPNNRGKAVVAPGRTGNGCRVNNPDGETQLYGHVKLDARWKNGDTVRKGERLGVIDLSGNTSGYHLHFEIWNKSGKVRNPRLDFNFHGVRPGEAPKVYVAPKPKPNTGKEWPYVKLLEDGKFQALTKKAYQRLLKPASVGNYRGLIDGKFEAMSVEAEQRWLKNRGYYNGLIDGKRQQLTIKGLQRLLRDRGLYTGLIDGKAQAMTVTGLQKLINSQASLYK